MEIYVFTLVYLGNHLSHTGATNELQGAKLVYQEGKSWPNSSDSHVISDKGQS